MEKHFLILQPSQSDATSLEPSPEPIFVFSPKRQSKIQLLSPVILLDEEEGIIFDFFIDKCPIERGRTNSYTPKSILKSQVQI